MTIPRVNVTKEVELHSQTLYSTFVTLQYKWDSKIMYFCINLIKQTKMIGTLVNVATVIIGGAIGILFKKKIPKKAMGIVFQGIGLITLGLGISMWLKSEALIVIVLAILAGGITGGILQLEDKTNRALNSLKKRFKNTGENFTEGLLTAFLLFCIGAMTIIGAIDEGMGNGSELLITKAIMDGFGAIALAAALGIGVLFSAIPLLIYQGSITLLAHYLGHFFAPSIVNELSATGGILLMGLGFNLMGVIKIKIMDLLPSLVYVVLFTYLYNLFM